MQQKKSLRARLSAKRLALMAIFVALSYAVSFLEIPMPILGAEFLKLDFGNVFLMLVGFLLGPIDAVIACVIKELLYLPVGGTGGVGQLANVIVTCSYILLPSIAYRTRKGLKIVVPSLCVAGLLATGVALLTNLYILFPLYGITDPQAFFQTVVGYLVAFNLIKTTSVSVLTLLLYKRLSNFIKGLRFDGGRYKAKRETSKQEEDND